ncbi:sodium bile acid symporter family-domain-containing protein [Globomyces pollinis-pini]|nr:sodium bile acid symporter family-domain-containing protein [Globomyces pollinis-pini]
MSINTINDPIVLSEIVENDPSTGNIKRKSELSLFDRYLTLWILLTMVLGTLLGVFIPGLRNALDVSKLANVSLPVFIGLLLMLYPVFCKVKYEHLGTMLSHKTAIPYLSFSALMNVIVCPLFMVALAWATLFDLPNFREGVILIGIARCIAMVLIWNDLAGGDAEWAAILVACNSILQLILFSPMMYLFVGLLGGGTHYIVNIGLIAKSVVLFLGIPFFAGILTRVVVVNVIGKPLRWYHEKFIPYISPLAPIGLTFTILVMFGLQGKLIVSQFGFCLRVTIPLLIYFPATFLFTMLLCRLIGITYEVALAISFTSASNNFELAMAVSIPTFGIDSQQSLATSIGPLIEVPVMLAIVNVCPLVKKYYLIKTSPEEIPLSEA